MIKLVNSILGQAVAEGASDIHFEPEDERDAHPLPRGRRAPGDRPGAEADGGRGDLADQDHERARHRREAGAAGRPRRRCGSTIGGSTCASPRCRRRAGRGPRSASSTRRPRCGRSTTSAWRARRGTASRTSFRKPYGAVLVTGPTGAGKSTTLYAALQEHQRRRQAHRHDRGPGRVPAQRRQPDRRQPQGGPHLRHRAALGPARRPRRDHGRRDPRRRDGADRRSRPRSPATWCSPRCTRTTRRARSPACRRWASSRSSPPRRSSAWSPSAWRGCSARSCKRRTVVSQAALEEAGFRVGHRPRGVRAGRLPALPRLRLPRPDGHLLGDGAERADQGDGRQPRLRRPRSRSVGDGGGDAHPAPGGDGEGALGADQRRRRSRGWPPSGSTHFLVSRAAAATDDWNPGMEAAAATPSAIRLRRDPHPDVRGARLGRPPHRRGIRRRSACAARSSPLEEYGPPLAAADPRHRLQPAQRRPAQALRVPQAARPRLRRARRRPLQGQLLLPARLDQRRLPADPASDPAARRARAAAGARGDDPQAARARPGHRPDRLR